MSIYRRLDKENMAYAHTQTHKTYNGILLSHKNNAICSYMDGPRSYQVQNMILSEGIQKEKE